MRRLTLLVPALLLTALLAVACGSSDDGADVVSGDSTTSTSDASTTTAPGAEVVEAIWPPADAAPVDDPAAVAVDFAEQYLGIAGAVAGEPAITEEPHVATVAVTKGADGATTTVQLGAAAGGGWYVLSASTDSIVVDSPSASTEVVSPLAVSGQANAFEGTVVVQVRPARSATVLGEGFVTGAMGELGAFSGEIAFEGATPGELGAAVFYAPDESGEGTAIAATVVPVRFTV